MACISGENVFMRMKFEGGVHRVQRVPRTERSGRVHTSTATVAVMARPTEVTVCIQLQVAVCLFCLSKSFFVHKLASI